MKKGFAAFLAIAMAAASLTACTGGSKDPGGASSSEPEPVSSAAPEEGQPATAIKYVAPGGAPEDYAMVFEKLNEKMAKDINVTLEVEYIPWDVWDQKINLKLTTKEPFDLFQIMQGRYDYQRYIADGALTDITSAVDTFGENIKANIPADLMANAKTTDGKLYIVPAYWYEPATSETCVLVRKDLRTRYGFELPKTPQELADQIAAVSAGWEGNARPYLPMDGSALFSRGPAFHRAYDRYPFYIKDQLAIFYTDGTPMGSWIESEEFKQDAKFYADAYKRGVISPDVLTQTNVQTSAQIANGDWYAMAGTSVELKSAGLTEEDLDVVFFQEDKPYMRPVSIKNSNAVPFTSTNPEAAVKFINWLYGNQENYSLFMYGLEDVHYKPIGGKQIETILKEGTESVGYSFADWMIGNINWIRYDPSSKSQKVCDILYTPKDGAMNHPADGFAFDASAVSAEYANVMTAIASYVNPVYAGVLDYDKEFPAALEKVKAAGLDKVIAEYQRQFLAFTKQ